MSSMSLLCPDVSSFSTMLTGLRVMHFSYDPKLRPGQLLAGGDHFFIGRITRAWDNCNLDDWLSEPTEWYVEYERPWAQSILGTTLGDTKIEWLEDQLFPSVGTVLEQNGHFRIGDIVRIVGHRH